MNVRSSGTKTRGASDVSAQIVAEAQREGAEEPCRVVSNLMRVGGSADHEQILGVPMLQAGGDDAGVRVRAHRRSAGDVRGLIRHGRRTGLCAEPAGPRIVAPAAFAISTILRVTYSDIFTSLSRQSKVMRTSGWP